MTQSVMVTSAEIDNASSRMKTVFELEKPVTSHEVYNRCMKHLNEVCRDIEQDVLRTWASRARSEEHTSELQSLMRISYAVFCLKTKKRIVEQTTTKRQATHN